MRNRTERILASGDWVIHTSRLDLQPLRREHAAVMFGVLADPALYEHTGGRPPSSVEAVAAWFQGWESRRSPDGAELWLNWTIRERAQGEHTGYVQATVGETHTDLAWVVGRPWQRQGYATESARAVVEWLAGLGVRRFRACAKPAHAASQRVAERIGLRRTDQWIDGEEVWLLER